MTIKGHNILPDKSGFSCNVPLPIAHDIKGSAGSNEPTCNQLYAQTVGRVLKIVNVGSGVMSRRDGLKVGLPLYPAPQWRTLTQPAVMSVLGQEIENVLLHGDKRISTWWLSGTSNVSWSRRP